MFQRDQLNQTPLSYAYGYGSRKNSNKPPSYLQVNEISNIINPTQQSDPVFMDSYANNSKSFTPTFQSQLGIPLNQSLPSVVSVPQQGTIFYGDLEQQTCKNLKCLVKGDNQRHCCVLIFNLILVAFVIFGISIITIFKLPIWMIAQMILVPYLLYFFFGFCTNALWNFFGNMKEYNYIDSVYQQLQQRSGNIQLKAQCFHYTKGKHRRRIVTHTAVQIIPIRQCIDASENLTQMKQNYQYLFCKIRKYFYFGDQNSHNTFINALSTFKLNNTKDTNQIFYHSLDITIPDFADEIGLSVSGGGGCLKPMFIIFLLLGLGYPYLMAIELMSQRFSINVVKKLTI